MNKLNKMLFWASGARIEILEMTPEFEKIKFKLIGASFLISSILSSISAIYALFLVSLNIILSILIGLMWGIMITNINRLLLFSIINNQKIKKNKILWFIFSSFFALLFSITIAYPLQLSLFEEEINYNISSKILKENRFINEHYDAKIESTHTRLNALREELAKELTGDNNRSAGQGPVARLLKQRIDETQIQIESLKKEKRYLLKDPSTQQTFIEKTISFNNLLKGNKIFSNIYLLIFILFFLVEAAPFIAAFFPKNGLYEELVEKIDSTPFNFETKKTKSKNINVCNPNEHELKNEFQNFCISSISDINHNIDNQKRSAQEHFKSGLLISLLGILSYLGYGAFLFIVYFESHKFQTYHIFLFSSSSVIFFFLQFLAGWHLKQYRATIDYANSMEKIKDKYNKIILSKIITSELPNNEKNKLIETKMLLEVITERKNNETTIESHQNTNFAKEVFDSLNNLKDILINPTKPNK